MRTKLRQAIRRGERLASPPVAQLNPTPAPPGSRLIDMIGSINRPAGKPTEQVIEPASALDVPTLKHVPEPLDLPEWLQDPIELEKTRATEKEENGQHDTSSDLNQHVNSEIIGFSGPGRMVWEDVLDQQRRKQTNTGHYSPSAEKKEIWPPIHQLNEAMTFRHWSALPENAEATRAVQDVLDHPSTRINPLVIVGTEGTGKSHLIWAAAASMAHRDPIHDVRIIDAKTLQQNNEIPLGWNEGLSSTSLLIVDDLDVLIGGASVLAQIGNVLDHALNLGVQVILTAAQWNPEQLDQDRMGRIAHSALPIKIHPLGVASRIILLRRRAMIRSIALTDSHLEAIQRWSDGDLRTTLASFDRVAHEIDGGAILTARDDVIDLLEGREAPVPSAEIELLKEDLDIERMVTDGLDRTMPDTLDPTLEIEYDDSIELEDQWTTPNLWPEDAIAATQATLESTSMGVVEELEEVPGRESRFADELRERRAISEKVANEDTIEVKSLQSLELHARTLQAQSEILQTIGDGLSSMQLDLVRAENEEEVEEVKSRFDSIQGDIEELDSGTWDEFEPSDPWMIDRSRVKAEELLDEGKAFLYPIRILTPDE